MFQIEFTPESLEDLRQLRKFDQQQIVTTIENQLPNQAIDETRHRKRLRPNQLAQWEIRVGDFRVFYDANVSTNVVMIVAIGYKQGNKLYVHGTEYEL